MSQRRGWLTEYELNYNRKLRKDNKFTKADKKKKKKEFDKTPTGMVMKASVELDVVYSPKSSPNKHSLQDDLSYVSATASVGSFSLNGADKVVSKLDLQPLRDVAYENYVHVESKLKHAKGVDYRQTAIGSKGGHIARLLGAPGPLNGHRTIQEADRLMCISLTKGPVEPPKPYVPLVLPEWCNRFMHDSCLASTDEKSRRKKTREVFSCRDVRKSLSRGTVLDPRDKRSIANTFGIDDSSTVLSADASITSFAPVMLPFSPIRRNDMADDDGANMMLNAEYMWHCMMTDLRTAASHIHYKDLIELSSLHHPSETVINVMSYFNVLLGISPTWEAARKYLFKELIPLLKFISGVEPLVMPDKRLLRATELREEKLLGLSPKSLALHSRPMAKIFTWILAFNKMANLIVTVNFRRTQKEKGDTQRSVVELGILKLEDEGQGHVYPTNEGNISASELDETTTVVSHLTIPAEISVDHPHHAIPMSDITDDFGASSRVSAMGLTPLMTERAPGAASKGKVDKGEQHREMSMVPELRSELFEQMSMDEQLTDTLLKYEPPKQPEENEGVNRSSYQDEIDHHHRTIGRISLRKSDNDIPYEPHDGDHAEWLKSTKSKKTKMEIIKDLDNEILEAYQNEGHTPVPDLSTHDKVQSALIESFHLREEEEDIFHEDDEEDDISGPRRVRKLAEIALMEQQQEQTNPSLVVENKTEDTTDTRDVNVQDTTDIAVKENNVEVEVAAEEPNNEEPEQTAAVANDNDAYDDEDYEDDGYGDTTFEDEFE